MDNQNTEIMNPEVTAKAPWKPFIGDIPFTMEYDHGTIFEAMERAAHKFPNYIAYEFMGRKVTYEKMLEEVRKCARSYRAIGVSKGDRVTLALPNCPQAVLSFYALSCIGAIANMVHPLSAQNELEFFINESESVTVVTLDLFYDKIEAIRRNTKLLNIVVASVKDEMSPMLMSGYMLTEGRKIRIPDTSTFALSCPSFAVMVYCSTSSGNTSRDVSIPSFSHRFIMAF